MYGLNGLCKWYHRCSQDKSTSETAGGGRSGHDGLGHRHGHRHGHPGDLAPQSTRALWGEISGISVLAAAPPAGLPVSQRRAECPAGWCGGVAPPTAAYLPALEALAVARPPSPPASHSRRPCAILV